MPHGVATVYGRQSRFLASFSDDWGCSAPITPPFRPAFLISHIKKTKGNDDDRQQKRTAANSESVPARASKRDKTGTGCWHQCAGNPRRKAAYHPACPCGRADGFGTVTPSFLRCTGACNVGRSLSGRGCNPPQQSYADALLDDILKRGAKTVKPKRA